MKVQSLYSFSKGFVLCIEIMLLSSLSNIRHLEIKIRDVKPKYCHENYINNFLIGLHDDNQYMVYLLGLVHTLNFSCRT